MHNGIIKQGIRVHIEPPNTRLASLKDFLKHYLMIVLSILTALGLEAWIEHAHHAHAAEEASVRIEAEIRANLSELDTSLAMDTKRAQALEALRDSLVQDFKNNTPDAVIAQHILDRMKASDLNLNLRWPTLRHQAWDMAITSQAAGWLDSDRLYRYSTAYAYQSESTTNLDTNIGIVMNGSQMTNTMTDLQTGKVQPLEFLRVVNQMVLVQHQAMDNLKSLKQHLEAALPEASHNSAATAS
jgi:hypothetical protein